MKPNASGKNLTVWTEEVLSNRRSVGVAEKRLQVECVSHLITKLENPDQLFNRLNGRLISHLISISISQFLTSLAMHHCRLGFDVINCTVLCSIRIELP